MHNLGEDSSVKVYLFVFAILLLISNRSPTGLSVPWFFCPPVLVGCNSSMNVHYTKAARK